MYIEQIVLNRAENVFLVQYRDVAGRGGTLIRPAQEQQVTDLLAAAETHLPPPEEHPDLEEVQREIVALTRQLSKLKESIGTG